MRRTYTKRNLALTLAAVSAALITGLSASPQEFSFFTPAEIQSTKRVTTFSDTYKKTSSQWSKGLDERDVFLASLKHTGAKESSWEMRIGKGGQLYSFRGPFGEAIPPQWRKDHATHKESAWNDEVWQMVLVHPLYNSLLKNEDKVLFRNAKINVPNFFIHQSGPYQKHDGAYMKEFTYNPTLYSHFDKENHSFSVVNWGQVAHIPTTYKSHILFYSTFKNLGDGIIEVDYAAYNYGEDDMMVASAPWGGVRQTVFTTAIVSKPDGSTFYKDGPMAQKDNHMNVSTTGGWAGYVEDANDPHSSTFSVVFGKDNTWDEQRSLREAKKEHYQLSERNWTLGFIRQKERDFAMGNMAPRMIVKKGELFMAKLFFVMTSLDKTTEICNKLVPCSNFSVRSLSPADSPVHPIYSHTSAGVSSFSMQANSSQPLFYLYTWPVENSKPVFLLKDNRSGQYTASCDPYLFSSKEPYVEKILPAGHPVKKHFAGRNIVRPYDGNTSYVALLGYSMQDDTVAPPKGYIFQKRAALTLPNVKQVGECDAQAVYLQKQ